MAMSIFGRRFTYTPRPATTSTSYRCPRTRFTHSVVQHALTTGEIVDHETVHKYAIFDLETVHKYAIFDLETVHKYAIFDHETVHKYAIFDLETV